MKAGKHINKDVEQFNSALFLQFVFTAMLLTMVKVRINSISLIMVICMVSLASIAYTVVSTHTNKKVEQYERNTGITMFVVGMICFGICMMILIYDLRLNVWIILALLVPIIANLLFLKRQQRRKENNNSHTNMARCAGAIAFVFVFLMTKYAEQSHIYYIMLFGAYLMSFFMIQGGVLKLGERRKGPA